METSGTVRHYADDVSDYGCGESPKKPFCDNSHFNGFDAPGSAPDSGGRAENR
jgi:CDGSH-type Zn-finger protein